LSSKSKDARIFFDFWAFFLTLRLEKALLKGLLAQNG